MRSPSDGAPLLGSVTTAPTAFATATLLATFLDLLAHRLALGLVDDAIAVRVGALAKLIAAFLATLAVTAFATTTALATTTFTATTFTATRISAVPAFATRAGIALPHTRGRTAITTRASFFTERDAPLALHSGCAPGAALGAALCFGRSRAVRAALGRGRVGEGQK